MKITIESTDRVEVLAGVPVRLWRGATEAGAPLVAWIALVGVAGDEVPDDLIPVEAVAFALFRGGPGPAYGDDLPPEKG